MVEDNADNTSSRLPKSVCRMVSSSLVGSSTFFALVTSRTNAKTGISRDSSSDTTYLPVRPVAPATATRLGDGDDDDEVESSELAAAAKWTSG